MKALLIGSNGYLGQNVFTYFRSRGIELRCLDVQSRSVITETDYQTLDVTDSNSVRQVDWNVDAIIHLAGLTGTRASNDDPVRFTQVNEIGLQRMLDAIRRSGSRPHVIFPSTRLVYKGHERPLTEQSETECKTVYAINKLSCESLLRVYSQVYSLKYTCFRICVPYASLGSADYSYGTVGFMMRQAAQGEIVLYGDGTQRRTFTHVGDIAAIILATLRNDAVCNDVYNIGGETFSLGQVAALIADRKGCRVTRMPWPKEDLLLESGDTVFDDRKLQRDLGYRYEYQLGQWLAELGE